MTAADVPQVGVVLAAPVDIGSDVGVGPQPTQALLGYDISEKFSLAAGYRILPLDNESDPGDEDDLKYDVVQSGAGLGLAYRF